MSDNVSLLFRLVLKACGAGYPIRVAVAASFATSIRYLSKLGTRYYPDSELLTFISNSSFYEIFFIAIGLLFAPIIWRTKGAPETAVQQVNVIDLLLARSGLSKAQSIMVWRSIIDKYLQAAQPDLQGNPDLISIMNEAAAEAPPDAPG